MKTLVFLVPLVFTACYTPRISLPKDIFLQIQEIEKPTIHNLDDIQKSYIKLFKAYQLNLNLLKTIENVQK